MNVTVVHNASAGHTDIGPEQLSRLITRAGHTPTFCEVDSTACRDLLREPGARLPQRDGGQDLVVVAGGDGSVRSVGQALLHRGVPMTILPMGTANNVAGHLGLVGSLEELIGAWSRARAVRFDVGRVTAPWGTQVFLEACGVGALARTMAALTPVDAPPAEDGTPHDELARDVEVTRAMLADHPPHECVVDLDGEQVEGAFVVVEVLNIRSLGARIQLAPDADVSDGLLDVVLIDDVGRRHLHTYLTARLDGKRAARLDLPVRRAANVRIRWSGSRVHVDDELYPDEAAASEGRHWRATGHVEIGIDVLPGALTFLVP
jgi:diacylglycerol kinase family enzyme